MKNKIIFSAGGTGGHIFPAINLMKHFYQKGYEVLLVTDKRGENFIKNHSEFKYYILKTSTTTNKNFLKKIVSSLIILYSLLKSFLFLKKEKPDLIFGLGGYVSFPICFVSKFLNLPLVIYENNMVLGRANRYLAWFSKKIFLSKNIIKYFPEKYKKKIHEVGPIINKNIINYKISEKQYNNENFSILVLGGSQGAKIFGEVIPSAIKLLKDEGYEIKIIQQCTPEQKNSIKEYYDKNNIKNYVFEFDKNILDLILSSDMAITRCGASATAELAYTNTPFIAIPLPNSIDDHQYLNAKYYEKEGCCWVLEQHNFNTKNLFNLIIENVKDKNKLKNIREKMKEKYKNNVYSEIEDKIKEII
tara:strand:- start:8246 stop:9325 length:1080 start_codon:yes stop_codon:yes gene_type:complete